MADPDDLKLLGSGELNLSDCDFSQADLSGLDLKGRRFNRSKLTNARAPKATLSGVDLSTAKVMGLDLSGADLRGARFGGALSRVNFSGANLQGAQISGLISRTNFKGADVRGTNFSGVTIREECNFDEAVYDARTNFEGVSTSRAVARLPIFQDYDLIDGRLRRRGTTAGTTAGTPTEAPVGQDLPDHEEPSISVLENAETASPTSTNLTLSQPAIASQLSRALSERIEKEIEVLNRDIPNEPSALDAHEHYVELLTFIRDQITKVSELLETENGHVPNVAGAKSVLDGIGNAIRDWGQENGQRALQYGVDVTMLGVGISFLASCGITSMLSFPVLVAILCGKDVAELITKRGE